MVQNNICLLTCLMINIKILGITDAKDSGACLVEDGKILCAINGERLTRVKLENTFPKNSIEKNS